MKFLDFEWRSVSDVLALTPVSIQTTMGKETSATNDNSKESSPKTSTASPPKQVWSLSNTSLLVENEIFDTIFANETCLQGLIISVCLIECFKS